MKCIKLRFVFTSHRLDSLILPSFSVWTNQKISKENLWIYLWCEMEQLRRLWFTGWCRDKVKTHSYICYSIKGIDNPNEWINIAELLFSSKHLWIQSSGSIIPMNGLTLLSSYLAQNIFGFKVLVHKLFEKISRQHCILS